MPKPLRLGVAGVGTVGVGVLTMLRAHAERLATRCGRDVQVTAVSARDREKRRGVDLSPFEWFDDPRDLARSRDIDVFIELIGGAGDPAYSAVEAALDAGKHVVTANKALLAHHGVALAELAEARDVALKFEAAVAGGIPVVKVLRESLLGNEVARVYGILNGTSNYILTRMQHEGRAFDEVLSEAQAAGYAEADPTFDIGGQDAAHKLAILTSLAFGTQISYDSIYLEGIEQIDDVDIRSADRLGYRIKLLGVAMKTESGIEQRVHPTMVPKHTAIAEVDGVTNAITIEGDFVGDIMLVGPGAGAGPTASAVVSDITDIARGVDGAPFIVPASKLALYERAQMRAHEGGYYIRLSVYDRPGAFAAIARRMAEQEISLKSIVQSPEEGDVAQGEEGSGAPVPVVMITHRTTEAAIRRAFDAIEGDRHIDRPPKMIRIEGM
ncbi:homoserine dehydrogenase [Dichotomicrobium thermohalophilum]|uniref:Homoserine dehydrogenase n=1 Tax=Dichotomicrobium thermohalophilum TaxID=933063 RepID=A0A397PCA8_9HYPH|nr:homoserine dehydrogenase [Dichotomicrobium thermohalophilum]RIA47210.1 homoserine dehydrogenase [Dichotomicrobium thermohalophilum]